MAETATLLGLGQPDSTTGEIKLRILAGVLIVFGLVRLLGSMDGAPYRNDFAHYYIGAQAVLAGADPYATPLEPLYEQLGFEYDRRIPLGNQPPLVLRMFTAVAWLPPAVGHAVWAVGQFACLAVLLWSVGQILAVGRRDRWWPVFVALAINSTSLQSNFFYSQVQLLVAATLAVALLARLRGRAVLACAVVALAASFKLYPAVLLPWFVLSGTRRWQDWLARSLVVTAVLAGVASVTGVEVWHAFLTRGMPVLQANMAGASFTNYSLQAYSTICVRHLLVDAANAKLVASAAALVIILAAYIVLWRRSLSPIAAFCLLSVVMTAGSLVAWSHYMVLMMLPAAVLVQTGMRSQNKWQRWLSIAVAIACLMPELDWGLLPASQDFWRYAIHYYPLYAMLAAGILFAGMSAELKEDSSAGTC